MGNRFWEFYLVRYLLGTIFGIVILMYLVLNYNEIITKAFFNNVKYDASVKEELNSFLFDSTYSLKKEDFNVIFKNIGGSFGKESKETNDIIFKQSGLTVLAAIILTVSGFLYMYFSSMLILILHGMRLYIITILESLHFQIPRLNLNRVWQKINDKKFKFIIHLALLLFTVMFAIFASNEMYRHVISIVIILWWACMMALTYPSIRNFYRNLASFRSKASKINYRIKLIKSVNIKVSQNKQFPSQKSEYIESYKHLREHGNAFGIIICEMLFAAWWIWWDFSFWAIFYWCLMGFSSWLLGTYLEVSAVKHDEDS